jgi:competence ComEA-like helix-hairpin-helix protein
MLTLHLCLCFLLLAVSSATKKPPPQPININTADSAQLQLVPGIGPSTAEKILQMRKSYGTFKSVNDLMAIRGLGPKRLEKMGKYITVGKPAVSAPNTAQPASCSGCAKPKPHAPTKSAATQNAPPPRPSTEQAAPETGEP